jgi:hypothetical protein
MINSMVFGGFSDKNALGVKDSHRDVKIITGHRKNSVFSPP